MGPLSSCSPTGVGSAWLEISINKAVKFEIITADSASISLQSKLHVFLLSISWKPNFLGLVTESKASTDPKMPAELETSIYRRRETANIVRNTSKFIPHVKERWGRPTSNSVGFDNNISATRHPGRHDPATGEVLQDDAKTNTINRSLNVSMYSLERWLTQGRKEAPWVPLQPSTDKYCDILVSEASISGAKDIYNRSMIVEVGIEEVSRTDIFCGCACPHLEFNSGFLSLCLKLRVHRQAFCP